MEIKKKIKFTITFLLILLAAFCALIYVSFKQYIDSLKRSTIADQVTNVILNEQLIASDYLFSAESRSKMQWDTLQEKNRALIASHSHIHDASEALIEKIKDHLARADVIFEQLVTLGTGISDASLRREKGRQLLEELALEMQGTSLLSSQLAELNAREASVYLARILILFSSMAFLLFVVMLYSFRVIWSGVVRLDAAKIESQHKQDRLNILMQSIGDGVVAIDREWNITLWNKATTELTGWKPEEVMGKPMRNFLKFILEHSRKENIAFIEEAMLFGRTGFMEGNTVFLTKEGREVPTEDSASPVFDKNKQVDGAIIIFRDASKKREAMSLRSDFTYASHQIRTPITKALWLAERALQMEDVETMRSNIKSVYLSLQSVNKLGEELLEVSKIDQHLIVPDFEDTPLGGLLGEILTIATEKAKNYGVPLSISSTPPLEFNPSVVIKTDPKLLKRILAEVLDNAIIYSVSKKPIDVSVTVSDKSALIKIADSGIGITEEQKPLIFTKFFRGSNFNTTEIAGAGLGLFIAREYVKILHGKIWFESTENKGTTFYVSVSIE